MVATPLSCAELRATPVSVRRKNIKMNPYSFLVLLLFTLVSVGCIQEARNTQIDREILRAWADSDMVKKREEAAVHKQGWIRDGKLFSFVMSTADPSNLPPGNKRGRIKEEVIPNGFFVYPSGEHFESIDQVINHLERLPLEALREELVYPKLQ